MATQKSYLQSNGYHFDGTVRTTTDCYVCGHRDFSVNLEIWLDTRGRSDGHCAYAVCPYCGEELMHYYRLKPNGRAEIKLFVPR